MIRWRLAGVVAGLGLVACSPDYKAEIQSNTAWSGVFVNRSVEGHGFQIVDLPDDAAHCVTVDKDTEEGYLRIRITAEGGGWFGPGDSDWVETTASRGWASACGN